MLDGDELGASATSARVVRDILWFERWFLAPPAMSALRLLAIGTLDPRLADRLGLRLTREQQRRFERLDAALRRHYSRLPAGRTRASRLLPGATPSCPKGVIMGAPSPEESHGH